MVDVGVAALRSLWLRGGFPRSFLATGEPESFAWRTDFLRTFIDRNFGTLANVPIHLHGRGATGPVALHAAVLADVERAIAGVTLAESLASWQSLVQARFHERELANIVPEALRHYDLPDLAAVLGDRLTDGL